MTCLSREYGICTHYSTNTKKLWKKCKFKHLNDGKYKRKRTEKEIYFDVSNWKKDWIELFRPQIIRYSVKFMGN